LLSSKRHRGRKSRWLKKSGLFAEKGEERGPHVSRDQFRKIQTRLAAQQDTAVEGFRTLNGVALGRQKREVGAQGR